MYFPAKKRTQESNFSHYKFAGLSQLGYEHTKQSYGSFRNLIFSQNIKFLKKQYPKYPTYI